MWIRFQGNWIQHNNCCFQKNTNGLPSDGKSFENDWIWKFWKEFLHTVFHYFAEKGASSLVLITLRHLNYGNALDVDSKHCYSILKVDEFRWKIHKKKKTAKANTVSSIVRQLVGILSTTLWSREEDTVCTSNLKLLMIKFVDPIFESC